MNGSKSSSLTKNNSLLSTFHKFMGRDHASLDWLNISNSGIPVSIIIDSISSEYVMKENNNKNISIQNNSQCLYSYFIHHGIIMRNKLRRFCFTRAYVVTKVLKIEICSFELNV